MEAPKIMTHLPGPKSAQIIKQDEHYTSPSYTRAYPLVAKQGRGFTIEDYDGNIFLDFTAGIAVCATGHCHPEIVKVIKDQASKLIHMSGTDFYYKPQSDLAKKLAEIAPGKSPKKIFYTNSGAESVEAAFKLARYATERQRIISFLGALHGRTFGALSLTASKIRQIKHFAPLVPEVHHIPYGYCYRCPYNLTYPKCKIYCITYIEEELFKKDIPPEEVCAFIVEPIQGEGGYIVPPPEYHPTLKKLAKKYGILYIADEVQAGMGRTGKMFAIEHWGVEPDIICLAKGIASGLPLGAMIARSKLMVWEKGAHASTFGGNPLSCRASLKTIELLQKKYMNNAAKVGAYMINRLKAIQETSPVIGDVRGKGLMIAAEIVKNKKTKTKAPKIRETIIQRCFKKGLLLLGCGDTAVRFSPSLIVTKQAADKALEIFEGSLKTIKK
ncbi:MAG: acetyl ornithine aminotransferase family protein [Nitrospinota bacterium]